MKIQARKKSVNSMELIVPVDGRITIDANGVAEVSEKCASVLVNGTNDWDYVDVEENEDEVGEDDEREQLLKHLNTLKLEELKEFAKNGEADEEEYGKIKTKKLLVEYLMSKFDEASESKVDDEVTEDEDEEEEED